MSKKKKKKQLSRTDSKKSKEKKKRKRKATSLTRKKKLKIKKKRLLYPENEKTKQIKKATRQRVTGGENKIKATRKKSRKNLFSLNFLFILERKHFGEPGEKIPKLHHLLSILHTQPNTVQKSIPSHFFF